MTQTPTNTDLAAKARHLVRGARTASLATTMRQDQSPYASLVAVASDAAGAPILLLSDLAEHSQNLGADNRASILFAALEGLVEPLTGLRVSLQGRIEASDLATDRRRYLNHHPDAAVYADFADFKVYRLAVERIHLVAGFGVIRWLAAKEYLYASQPDLGAADFVGSVIEHMNTDHGDALNLLAGDGERGWKLSDFDGEGIDLRCDGRHRRIAFRTPIRDAGQVRAALVALAKTASGLSI